MTSKLDKLMAQVAEEKARMKAKEKAKEQKQIADVSRLVIKSGISGLPYVFLQEAFAQIKAGFEANHQQHVADFKSEGGV